MKREKRDPGLLLQDIAEAIARIDEWRSAGDFDAIALTHPGMTESALARQLAIIGEAASRLDRGYKAAHREVKWRAVIDMRNAVVHDYFDVDRLQVSSALKCLPQLRRLVGSAPPREPQSLASRFADIVATGPGLASPGRRPPSTRCDLYMPRAKVRCILRLGHAGPHRST